MFMGKEKNTEKSYYRTSLAPYLSHSLFYQFLELCLGNTVFSYINNYILIKVVTLGPKIPTSNCIRRPRYFKCRLQATERLVCLRQGLNYVALAELKLTI